MRKSYFLLLFAAMFTLFSCNNEKQPNNPPLSEEDKIVNELMAQCQNFDAEDIIYGLPGEWDAYFQLFYDDAWQVIEECHMLAGKWQPGHNIGVPEIKRYTFTSDGKGAYHVYSYFNGPESEWYIASFDWQYNVENRTLVLEGEHSHQFVVSGFNGEYLVWDWTNSHGNFREIYKRKAE